jgi:DNA-directed RNA polymerase subunit M/transcription elongation factor TFIIS
MASEERKAQDEKLAAENLFKAQGAKIQFAETDQFKCGKCGQRKCSYYQMQVSQLSPLRHEKRCFIFYRSVLTQAFNPQTRSADEPMTVRARVSLSLLWNVY